LREVRIKTLHGSFPFLVQRLGTGAAVTNWLRETGQVGPDYITPRLAEFSAYYSKSLSYEGVAELVERVTGERQVSAAKIQQIVVKQAEAVSEQWGPEPGPGRTARIQAGHCRPSGTLRSGSGGNFGFE
jgi:hypothetical protein